jgi:ketosteroid isomerase-like protein
LAHGKAELRRAFEGILQSKGTAKQEKTHVLEADGVALFISKWTFSGQMPDGTMSSRKFIATSVFRKSPDGQWRLIIDNSFSPAVLGQ